MALTCVSFFQVCDPLAATSVAHPGSPLQWQPLSPKPEAHAWVLEQPSSPQTLRSVALAGLALQPGEALVALTTVCGSDLHTASG